jgi:RNA polymerase sigma-70 factor (family 1)
MSEGFKYTENQLLTAFRAGQESGFTALFNDLYPALCFYALRYTNDQAAAEDISAESLVKIWERKATFYQFNVLKSYLYTTVRNAAINWSKQSRRRRINETTILANSDHYHEPIVEYIIRAETFRQVYAILDSLPTGCGRILKMIFVDGKSTHEIAKELDISLSTVKSQKIRGLKLMRKLWPSLSLILLAMVNALAIKVSI